MGRPPLPLGTAGSISVTTIAPGRVRARCRYRDYDGVTRWVERNGTSAQNARGRLNDYLKERKRIDGGGDITAETLFREVADRFLSEWDEMVKSGKRSPNTASLYRLHLGNYVTPGIGNLRLREITVGRADALLKSIAKKWGNGSAKVSRTVLSGVMGMAVRHDALETNPVRDVSAMGGGARRLARALTMQEIALLRGRLLADKVAFGRDIPQMVDFMLATGMRVGEACAVTWDAVDLDAGTVDVRGTVIREKGKGLRVKEKPKTVSGFRTLELPSWAVRLLSMRKEIQDENAHNAVFIALRGGLRDPVKVNTQIRDALSGDVTGEDGEVIWPAFDWVTTHVFRKTVLTLMDLANLPARAAADQAGHAKVSMTQDNYFGRRIKTTGAPAVLEEIAGGIQS